MDPVSTPPKIALLKRQSQKGPSQNRIEKASSKTNLDILGNFAAKVFINVEDFPLAAAS